MNSNPELQFIEIEAAIPAGTGDNGTAVERAGAERSEERLLGKECQY